MTSFHFALCFVNGVLWSLTAGFYYGSLSVPDYTRAPDEDVLIIAHTCLIIAVVTAILLGVSYM